MSRAPTRAFHGERTNAVLSWVAVAIVLVVGVQSFRAGLVHGVLFAATVVTIVTLWGLPSLTEVTDAVTDRLERLPWL